MAVFRQNKFGVIIPTDRLYDDGPPVTVHDGELASVLWHLSDDVFRAEDGLEIHPHGLTLQHGVYDLLHVLQLLLPQLKTDKREQERNIHKPSQSSYNSHTTFTYIIYNVEDTVVSTFKSPAAMTKRSPNMNQCCVFARVCGMMIPLCRSRWV